MFNTCLLLLALSQQDISRPLPDAPSFIQEFRKTLHGDSVLLSQYTYTETETEITLDGGGKEKKRELNVYQVTHGAEEWQTYRRHISKNGVPLPDKDLEKQDRDEANRVAKEKRKQEGRPESKRKAEKDKADREEQEITDDIFAMYDIQFIRREMLNDVPTILMTFRARPDCKPKTGEGKIFQHIAGRAWVAEDDHELAKVEAELIDGISFGAGLLAKLQKGSTITAERKKVNGEIWLPLREEALVNGKLLVFKGINVHEINEFSDYRKYSVDTIIKVGEPVKPKPQ